MLRSKLLPRFTHPLVVVLCLLLMLVMSSAISFAAADARMEPASGDAAASPHQLYLPLLQNGASDAIWSDTTESLSAAQSERVLIPQKYRAVTLNVNALQQLLQATPLEQSAAARRTPVLFSLPLPDGTVGRFRIVESPIMAPALAAKFPEIKTYAGQGIDDPTATVRFDWTPAGFHAQILAASGAGYIDPYSRHDMVHYISYFKRDYQPPVGSGIKEPPQPSAEPARLQALQALVEQYQASRVQAAAAGTQLRTYRLAMASDGEHTIAAGGTVAAAMADIATTVNRVTGIFETEVAVRLELVANNDLLIYTDPDIDPYTDADPGAMLTENQTNVDTVIGNGNYDIGHVLTASPGGGVAYLSSVCANTIKAGGNSGAGDNSIGDPFIVDFVAHEIGHQFGGTHIFNDSNACGPYRSATTTYEPGSGSTIMSYAGTCLSQDLQPHNDSFFNTANFDQIVAFSTLGGGNSCPVTTNTGNSAPVVNAGADSFTIPRQTPFTLTGSATDADGDALTYSWEEHDLGDADGSLANNPLEAPFFRSFPPVTSPSRTFPRWSDIINNTSTIGEILPNVSRALNFRLTARDNRSGGSGVDYSSTTVNVTTAAGPFLVTAPNTAVIWTGGATENVTWDVANTGAAPVNCTSVNLLLSTDGGLTYPTTLASSVPNNGSASVTAPNLATTTARVQVVCATNIFFDISNTNFSITQSASTPTATNTPTNTPVVPTAMPTNTPTNTPVVSTATATNTPTNTPVGPTATATKTPKPATPTKTPKPATPTKTPKPATPTKTPEPPAATPTPDKVNGQLDDNNDFKTISSTTSPDATYPAQSPKGVAVLRLKTENEGRSLRNITFHVRKLTQGNYLLNADGGPGQVGSILSVPNSALPGGNQLLDEDEKLTQEFHIGLMARSGFTFQVDVYANKTTVATAQADSTGATETEELVASYLVDVDPEASVIPDNTIYLPIVSNH